MPSLAKLRHDLSARFGGYEEYIAGVQLQEGGGYAGVPSGVEAKRRLISTDLLDMDLVGTSSDASAFYFDGAYAFIPSTREQRRVPQAGYVQNVTASTVLTVTGTAATALVGYLILNRPLMTALQPNTVFESHRWPVRDDDRRKGLHTAINEALTRLFVPDRLSVTGLGSTVNRYTLAAYPWITDEMQLVEAQGEETVSGLDAYPLSGGSMIRLDGDTPYLITGSGVAAGTVFTIDVMRPRSSWIKRGGTWGESTVGLQDDTDECTGSAGRIVTFAEWIICRHMENGDPAGPKGNWALRSARLADAMKPWLQKQYVRGSRSAVGTNGAFLANVPGGLREVAWRGNGGTSWP